MQIKFVLHDILLNACKNKFQDMDIMSKMDNYTQEDLILHH
jgi:hypothetical protein